MKLNLGYTISLPVEFLQNFVFSEFSKNINSIQIMFSKNKLDNNDIKQIKSIIKNFKYIYIHASYQINISAELINEYNPAIELLLNEIVYMNKINGKGIVLHTGKNVKKQYNPDVVYNNMVEFIILLFNKLKKMKLKINLLIETPAGQGGEMCYDLEEFVNFILLFKPTDFYEQIGICIDTCHIFQAGYDLNNKEIIKKVHKIFSPVQDKIGLIHLNDSYHPFGQHIDRHQQLGKGNIQINNLIKFIYPYKHVPMILETNPPYDEQIRLLIK